MHLQQQLLRDNVQTAADDGVYPDHRVIFPRAEARAEMALNGGNTDDGRSQKNRMRNSFEGLPAMPRIT